MIVKKWLNLGWLEATYYKVDRPNVVYFKLQVMLKSTVLTLFVLFSFISFSQLNPSQPVMLFGQGMIEVADIASAQALEAELRNHPNVKIVRIDYNSQRALVFTKDIQSLTEEQFASWFGLYSDKLRCIQVGTHGVDQMNAFPFENCEK